MKVVITGSSSGIGAATAEKFLTCDHEVYGIDINENYPKYFDQYKYTHINKDVRNYASLPVINFVDILINNAGAQNSEDDIDTNLKGVINTTKMYGLHPKIKSILNLASVSAHNGAEFPEYVASKGGVLSYTVWTAKHVAKYGATCNSLSFGGVLTPLNAPIMFNDKKWKQIMSMTPLEKWMVPGECAEWIYFFTVVNKSCTGQDLIIDNGEMINHTFVW